MAKNKDTVQISDVITWSEMQVASVVKGKIVLMNISVGRYHSLDDIASVIWRMLENPTHVGELCHTLAVRYKADEDTVTRDVMVLLNRLLNEQLIVVQGS